MKIRNRTWWGSLVIAVLLSLSACNQTTVDADSQVADREPAETQEPVKQVAKLIYEDIGPEAFQAKIGMANSVLLDVRTPQEVSEGMLDGAMVLDYHWDQFGEALTKLDKEQTVLVYCRSGGRSGRTMTKLKEMGFPEVYNLAGGITAWKAAGLPITTPTQ